MHDTLTRLDKHNFPPLRRHRLRTLQVNLGYQCNQQCVHCHVNAGPHRTEVMSGENVDLVLRFLENSPVETLDLTGGAPELNLHFRRLVREARSLGKQVIDRCNLTILEYPGQENLAEFLAEQEVAVIASLPCYLERNVNRQRGTGVFAASLRGLRQLNTLGYGDGSARLPLHLVYNPQDAVLPPAQEALEADYKRELGRLGVHFDHLYTLCNMPIKRFGSMLVSRGDFDDYMRLLASNHRPENLEKVMCRDLLSVDWQAYVYDCDFNQMLGLGLDGERGAKRVPLSRLLGKDLSGRSIQVRDHCYGCTAGQGSSCGGALV